MNGARALYSLLWWLASPLARTYLRRRARKQPAYLEHWDERFEAIPPPSPSGAIWIHAVSVGETRAAAPLIAALRQRYPALPLLLTQMTPTGRETAEQLFGADAHVRYLPYDRPDCVARFLDSVRPRLGVLMETELWPNLIQACRQRGIPLFLANARLSEKSARGYRRIAPLIRPALAALRGVAAQTPADAARLQALGAQTVDVLGNTKFDCTPPAQAAELATQFRRWTGARPVLVLASTREGEEALLLGALPADFPAVVVLVPRHPQRFDEVAGLLAARGIPFQRRSENRALAPDCRVWLGDSMGELFAYYQAADLAFVGGSLMPLGGQNLIEPAAVGCPVLIGPSTFNFTQVAEAALAVGAALAVEDAAGVWRAAAELLSDPARREAMALAGRRFAAMHQGASVRIADWIVARA